MWTCEMGGVWIRHRFSSYAIVPFHMRTRNFGLLDFTEIAPFGRLAYALRQGRLFFFRVRRVVGGYVTIWDFDRPDMTALLLGWSAPTPTC